MGVITVWSFYDSLLSPPGWVSILNLPPRTDGKRDILKWEYGVPIHLENPGVPEGVPRRKNTNP